MDEYKCISCIISSKLFFQALSSSYKVLYNDSATVSIPVTLNLMNNALLKVLQSVAGGRSYT